MKDALGNSLLRWRTAVVLPFVRGRLLDVGCGTNLLVRRYRAVGRVAEQGTGWGDERCADGRDGIGVDVHPWEGVDQVIENAGALPFEDQSFDTVTIIAALNHIPNREAALREAHRALRRGGRLIVTMIPPAVSEVWHRLRAPWDADQHERGMVEGEVYGLTGRQVRRLLETSGFRIVGQRRFMLGLNRMTIGEKIEAPVSSLGLLKGRYEAHQSSILR